MSKEKETEKVEEQIEEPKIEEKPETLTVEALDEKIKELERKVKNKEEEAERVHKKLAKFEEDEKIRKQAEMTELEKLESRALDAEAKLQDLTIKEQKRSIAAEVGLPDVFALRIQGETPEELKADAQKLLDALPKPGKPIQPTNPGDNASSKKETDAERRQRLGI